MAVKIQTYNVDPYTCCQETCDKKATFIYNTKVGGEDVILMLCEEHFDKVYHEEAMRGVPSVS